MDRIVGADSPTQVLLRAKTILYILHILFVLTDRAMADGRQDPELHLSSTANRVVRPASMVIS
jgi:hypothetical protein